MNAAGRAVLGISADFHDAAAALLIDGEIVAAAAEERFSRRKHDPSFPEQAIRWCVASAGIDPGAVEAVAFYEKPFTKVERIIGSHLRQGPRSVGRLRRSLANAARERLWVGARTAGALDLAVCPKLLYCEHHVSHAAAAFHAGPFERSAVLTVDGVGERTTSTISRGVDHHIELLAELHYPNSLGLFYAAMTEFCGFEVNDGESKLMGLAPYGRPVYVDDLRRRVVHVGEDGAVRLDRRWFAFEKGRRMTAPALSELLDGTRRPDDAPLTQREADIAASAQVVLEDVMLAMAAHARRLTGESHLSLAGGVALNCVANGRLARSGLFDDIWVQPAPGDDGAAVGAALWAWHDVLDEPRRRPVGRDGMSGAALGPSYDGDEIARWLTNDAVPFERLADRDRLSREVAGWLAEGQAVGWFQGPMEFGPRALGHRSILADPRDASVVGRLNLSVKRRESFRPFAPAILASEAAAWFETDSLLPYMLQTALLRPEHRIDAMHRRDSTTPDDDLPSADFATRLEAQRSAVPACTHVDHSARVQTVTPDHHPQLHGLLVAFHELTGCPMLVNTSFNRRDEPIVRTPADALTCFNDTDLDVLVLEDCVVRRPEATAAVAAASARVTPAART